MAKSQNWLPLNDLALRLRLPKPHLARRLAGAGLYDPNTATPTGLAVEQQVARLATINFRATRWEYHIDRVRSILSQAEVTD